MELSSKPPRPHCYRCDKPALACLCARVPRLDNRTPIVIVQHRRESRHPLGTVRIAELGLENVLVNVVPGSATSDSSLPAWLPPSAGLLYPGPTARELTQLPKHEHPRALVVIDGTWHQARALFRDHAWLRTLPRFRLSPAEPSRYRIRREPAAHCVSTIEAIVQALEVLEPNLSGKHELLAAFDALIDDQLHHAATRARVPRARSLRPAAFRALPRVLLERFDDLVFVYGETARSEATDEPTELVHWSALRVRDAAAFDCVLRPELGLPSPTILKHVGLEREELLAGVDGAEFERLWRAFLRPDDVLAAWNPKTLARFDCIVPITNPRVELKSVHRRLRGVDGDLDRVLSLEPQAELPPAFAAGLAAVRGRARQRLTNVLTVALLLRSRALEANSGSEAEAC